MLLTRPAKFILTFLITALFSTQLFAQTLKLSGRVLNDQNQPVMGATISVEGTNGVVVADVEGRFSLNLQPGKKYTLTISSVGYNTKIVSDVDVAANADNSIEIVMETLAKTGEAVTVRSTRRQESTNALLAFQKSNTAVSSGLAADFIRRTPDKNTGEVLKRVSGASIQDNRFVVVRGLSDRYNAAVINNAQLPSTEPDKKAFSFDVFPASLIDNIVINKTATPDLTGEFAGGLVQVNTKDVPTKNSLSVGLSLGFNTISAFKDFQHNPRNSTDWVGFDDGTRSIPAGFPSTSQYRAWSANAAGRDLQLDASRTFRSDVYNIESSKAFPTSTFNITWGNTHTYKNDAKFGTVVSLVYRKSMLIYNDVQRKLHQDDGTELIFLNDVQNRYAVNIGAIANFTYVKGKHKISFKNLFNQLYEDNFYTRTGQSMDRIQDINFASSVLNQRTLYSGQIEGEHQLSTSGIKLRWNGNASYNWKIQPDLRTQSYFRPLGTSEAFEYNDDDTRRFDSDLEDFGYGANGSLLFPFIIGKEKQSVKVGGSTLLRIRNFNSRIFKYTPTDFTQFDDSKASLGFSEIFLPENIGLDGFIIEDFTNNQDTYFAASVVNGMFAMFDNNLSDKLRIVWGVRVENFQQFLTTHDVSAKRVIIDNDDWDVLPSVNFTFSPSNKHNFRLSGSRTVSRPEFREIAPFSFYDYEVNYAVNGNPDLKRGTILNGDARYEYYPRAGEAITLGVFYKKFDDPIEFRLNPSSVIDRRQYEYRNAEEAQTVGVELEIRKGLEFIGSSFKTFSVFANLTYINSTVTLASVSGTGVTTSSDRPLQGQSPYLVNLGLQYNSDNNKWNGSILYNRIGQRLALVGIDDLGFPDVYERPRDQLDLQLSRRILKNKAEIKLNWSDMLNADYFFYENVDSKKAYKTSSDRLFYSYTPGSTITIGFTYDFDLGKKTKN